MEIAIFIKLPFSAGFMINSNSIYANRIDALLAEINYEIKRCSNYMT